MTARSKLVVSLMLSGLVASGCAGSKGSAAIPHSTGAEELILRIEMGGGLVPQVLVLNSMPSFSIFGDGRIITQGPQDTIYPGPALPNLLVQQVDEQGLQAILSAAKDAGLLGPDRHYDDPTIVDASTTTFTVVAGGSVHVVSAYALQEGESAYSGDHEARQALIAFQSKLTDLTTWLPAGSLGRSTSFDFDGLRVFGREGVSPSDIPPQPTLDWPLPTGLANFGALGSDGYRCGTVSGSDLGLLLPLAKMANQLTPWRSGDQLYSLVFRPLLPDESGCPA